MQEKQVSITKTTCPYCGVGCGLEVTVELEQVMIKGDPEHPANFGRLCSKGSALAETLDLDGRLLHASIEGNNVSNEVALEYVATKFSDIIKQYGRESIAFYVSGQLLTEDYYVANKLMKGYIGTANIDTNSRLCMSSSVAGHKRAFGSDTVPCNYEDLEKSKVIVLAGSNAAWCHPVLYQRIAQARKYNPDLVIVVIDPRKTATADIADIFIPINPGTDVILFNGLLTYLHQQDELNQLYISQFTENFEEALQAASECSPSIEYVSSACGVDEKLIEQFYRLYARTERVITVYSQGINQSSAGTDKVNSIINCHLATGRIGRPGMGPFSFTGQPNAMGGREVGGLSNQLVAHMEIDNPHHREIVQEFWKSPLIPQQPGLKAVDMFNAVETGEIKAVWIMATNPADSLPDAERMQNILEQCEFVVVSDCISKTDTTRYANVLLPALAWGEKDGTITNSERRISRQRAFLDVPGNAKPDWWWICNIARKMGYQDFQYSTVTEIFREYASLTGYRNENNRDLDISFFSRISDEDYRDFLPVQWPASQANPRGTSRMFTDGRFFTSSGKAQFIPIQYRSPTSHTSPEYPYVLNTGRIRDQWHTMTRTGKSCRLSQHISEPYVELHPMDAKQISVVENDLVEISSIKSNIVVKVRIQESVKPGQVFVPMHWNNQFASNARVCKLINPSVDPISGQPESKYTPVKIHAYKPGWQGFLLSRRDISLPGLPYWSKSRKNGFWSYELTGDTVPENWSQYARDFLCREHDNVEWIEFSDKGQNKYRGARLENGRLESCIFIESRKSLSQREYLYTFFGREELNSQERMSLLSGSSPMPMEDPGRIVCACFNIGINTIKKAISESSLKSIEEIGKAIKAGTNCGSCIPELEKLLI